MGIKICATIGIVMALMVSSCHTVMPIEKAEEKGLVVIAFYDTSVGTDAIEDFIKKNDVEVIYQYTNLKGYALRLRDEKQQAALENVDGVLSVSKDDVVQVDGLRRCMTE